MATEAKLITAEMQSLSPSALITLFEVDTRPIDEEGGVLLFHAGTNEFMESVWQQGNEYIPMPIEASGFDVNSKGTLTRPKIKVANVKGLFSAMVRDLDDLVGAKLIRRRTFARFLDARNFKDGNPTADPMQAFPDDLWYFDQKTTENRDYIEWELASAFDLQGVKLPARQIIQNSCTWIYRSAECGYTGQWMDKYNKITWVAKEDVCPKTLEACRCRFASVNPTGYVNLILPFGGFPGAQRVSQ